MKMQLVAGIPFQFFITKHKKHAKNGSKQHTRQTKTIKPTTKTEEKAKQKLPQNETNRTEETLKHTPPKNTQN